MGVWYRLVYISSENLEYVRYVISEEAKGSSPPLIILTNSWIQLLSPFLAKMLEAYFTSSRHFQRDSCSMLGLRT